MFGKRCVFIMRGKGESVQVVVSKSKAISNPDEIP